MSAPWEDYGGGTATVEPTPAPAGGPWEDFKAPVQQSTGPWDDFPKPPPPSDTPASDAVAAASSPIIDKIGVGAATAYGQRMGGPTTAEVSAQMAAQPQWLKNAQDAAAEVMGGFVPKTAQAVAEFLTPVASLPAEAKQLYGAAHKLIAGEPLDQVIKQQYPESQQLAQAEQTSPYSKERFAAGFGTIANLVMGAQIAHGLGAPVAAERPGAPVAEVPAGTEAPPVQPSQVQPAPETPVAEAAPVETAPVQPEPGTGEVPLAEATLEAAAAPPAAAEAPPAGEAKPPEQLSPDEVFSAPYEYKKGQISAPETILAAQDMAQAEGKGDVFRGEQGSARLHHAATILTAAEEGKPVSAAAVEAYGLKLPEGYNKQGDVYSPPQAAEPPQVGGEPTAEPSAAPSEQPGAAPVPTEVPTGETAPQPQGSIEPVGVTHEAIDIERESRGLDPIERQASRNLGETWTQAAERTATDPNAPRRLTEQLATKPRALTDEDVALLLRRRVETRIEFDNAVADVNASANDPQALAEANNRLEQARKDYDQTQAAIKNSSSETGRGLRALQQMAMEDYSLVKMEARRRAANNGQPLTPRQAAETKALHDKIAELQQKLNVNDQVSRQADLEKQFTKLMRESRKGARESVKTGNKLTDFLDAQAARARERIVGRRGRLQAGIDPTSILDEAIIGASHIARGVTEFGAWSRTMLQELGERIRPYLQDLYNRAKALHEDSAKAFADRQEANLKRYKTTLVTRTEAVREKLAVGDLSKAIRNKTKLDAEAFQLRADYQKAKMDFDTAVRRDELKQRSAARKAIDFAVRAERSMKLTGITTLGKLAGAGATRLVTTPLERVLQTVARAVPVLSDVARAAPTERGLSPRAEAAAIRGVGTGVKQIPSIAKGIPTAHDVLYGRPSYPIGSKLETVLDIPQNIHGAIKAPFKESQRARVESGLQEWARSRGMDVNNPEVKQTLGQLADQSAKRAIFMQDNFISDWWRNGIRSLEQSKKAPTAGYITSKVMQFLLPIIKVPTNVVFEAATHIGGLGSGTVKLAGVMSRGLENIKPEEADFIMRHYSKGMIGAGLFFTGYFNAKNFGGFYIQHDKRAPGDVGAGAARIAGVNIPSWLLHAPAFIVMQAGATVYRMQHKMERGGEKGKVAGTIAAAKGLADEIPFVREMGVLDNILADGYEGRKARGNLLQSTVVPQVVKNVAQWTDPLQEPQYRTPQSEADYIKMAIPGLREQVPLHSTMPRRSSSHSTSTVPRVTVRTK